MSLSLNICYDPSFEQSRGDGYDDESQHKFSLGYKKKYPHQAVVDCVQDCHDQGKISGK